ncbi:hypothetical protein FVE85_2170 [Porphyridium purpureum]|uniref:Uncharacterized protein n=1 Tax=Porphyridium purpureum TaxID=35688 RepID=A0A5J4YXX5_PORPP|nr:hypothetical protein FVE85_2170 [Porphyridium purpureum]|eukprot:POR1203..scf209_3
MDWWEKRIREREQWRWPSNGSQGAVLPKPAWARGASMSILADTTPNVTVQNERSARASGVLLVFLLFLGLCTVLVPLAKHAGLLRVDLVELSFAQLRGEELSPSQGQAYFDDSDQRAVQTIQESRLTPDSREFNGKQSSAKVSEPMAEPGSARDSFGPRQTGTSQNQTHGTDNAGPIQHFAKAERLLAACPDQMLLMNARTKRKPVDENFNASEASFFGTVVIPELRLVVCTLPRSKALMMRALLGRLRLASAVNASYARTDEREARRLVTMPSAHIQLRSLPLHEIEQIARSSEWLKLAIVRHPFIRLLSGYNKVVRSGQAGMLHPSLPVTNETSFSDFVALVESRGPHELNEQLRDQSSMCAIPYMDHYFVIHSEQLRTALPCVARHLGFDDVVSSGWGKGDLFDLDDDRFDRVVVEREHADIFGRVLERFKSDFDLFRYLYSFEQLIDPKP